MEFLKNLANLIKVKTIVTMVVMAVFTVLSLRGDITADNAMIVISMVVSFYFGTVSEKKGGALGFGKDKGDATKEKIMKALSDFLRPEFLGRVDEIAVFNDLSVESFEKIADLLLNELHESLQEKSIELKWTADVAGYLAEKSIGGLRGARDLRNLIRKEIEDGIANIIIENADSMISAIALEIKDNNLSITHI